MRYFVPTFEAFGESNDSRLSPEFYMHTFAKVSHIKEHIRRGMHLRDSSEFTREKYKEYAKTYHGCATSDYSIAVTPKEVVVEYDIFFELLYKKDRNEHQNELGFSYNRTCELKIWLTTNDIFKLFNV